MHDLTVKKTDKKL